MASARTNGARSGRPEPASAPLGAAEVARLSDTEIVAMAKEAFALRSRQDALLALLGGELERRQGFRVRGATSLRDFFESELGMSGASARTYGALGEVLIDLPHLAEALSSGSVSLDKATVLAPVATPEDEAAWTARAQTLSWRDLRALVRSKVLPTAQRDRDEHEGRYLRFDDTRRALVARLESAAYASVKGALMARAKALGSDGETALDQRLADALVTVAEGKGSRALKTLVAHVPFEVLADPSSTLVAELDGLGLVSADVARHLACCSEVIVALDDARGHTLYEGRAQRLATETQRREVRRRDRHCVFPGCPHVLFCDVHHLVPWEAGGTTDLDNLVLLCAHHHHLIHSTGWSAWGDANVEVFFCGPDGEVRSTVPSPLWAQVSDPVLLAERRGRVEAGAGGEDPGG